MQTKKLAVFDFDGTLFLTDGALLKAALRVTGRPLTREEVWALPHPLSYAVRFATEQDTLTPEPNKNTIDRLNERAREGYKVVILTGRSQEAAEQTLEIARKNGLRYNEAYFHPGTLQPTFKEFKAQKLGELAEGYDLVEVYEDREHVINHYKAIFGPDKFIYFLVKDGKLLRV